MFVAGIARETQSLILTRSLVFTQRVNDFEITEDAGAKPFKPGPDPGGALLIPVVIASLVEVGVPHHYDFAVVCAQRFVPNRHVVLRTDKLCCHDHSDPG